MKFIHERKDRVSGMNYSKSVVVVGCRDTSLNEEIQRSVIEEIVKEAIDNGISVITTGFLGVDNIVSEVSKELGADLKRLCVKASIHQDDSIPNRIAHCQSGGNNKGYGIPMFFPIIVTDYAFKKTHRSRLMVSRFVNIAVKKNGYTLIINQPVEKKNPWEDEYYGISNAAERLRKAMADARERTVYPIATDEAIPQKPPEPKKVRRSKRESNTPSFEPIVTSTPRENVISTGEYVVSVDEEAQFNEYMKEQEKKLWNVLESTRESYDGDKYHFTVSLGEDQVLDAMETELGKRINSRLNNSNEIPY